MNDCDSSHGRRWPLADLWPLQVIRRLVINTRRLVMQNLNCAKYHILIAWKQCKFYVDQTSGYKNQTSGHLNFWLHNLSYFNREIIVQIIWWSDVWKWEPDVWSFEFLTINFIYKLQSRDSSKIVLSDVWFLTPDVWWTIVFIANCDIKVQSVSS